MQNDFYMLTDKGRRMGDVIVVLYRMNQYLNVQELVAHSGQSESLVREALSAFQELGQVEYLADSAKWGLLPEARLIIRRMELRMGREI